VLCQETMLNTIKDSRLSNNRKEQVSLKLNYVVHEDWLMRCKMSSLHDDKWTCSPPVNIAIILGFDKELQWVVKKIHLEY